MTQLSKKVIDSLAWYTFDYRKIKDEHKYDADLFFTVQIFRKWFNLVIQKQSFFQQQVCDDSSQQIDQSQFTDSSKPPLVTQSQILSSQVNYDSVPKQKINNLPLKKGQVSQSLNIDSYRQQIQPEEQNVQKQRRSQDMPLQFQENDFLNSLQSLEEMRLAHEEIAARINSLIALQQDFVDDIEKRQEISTELQQLQALGSLLKQKYNTNNTLDSSLQQPKLFYQMTLFNKVVNSFRKFAQIENIIIYRFAAKRDSRIMKQAFVALTSNNQKIANENYRKRVLRKGLFGLKKYQLMLMLMRTVRAGQEDRMIADVFMSWRSVFIERQIQNGRNQDLDLLLQVSDDFVSASRQNIQKQRVLSLDKFSSSKSARRYLVSDQEDYNNVGSHLISEQNDESMTSDISSEIKLSSLANEMNFDKIMNAKNNNFEEDGNSLLCDILNNLKDCSQNNEQQLEKDDEQSEAKEIQNFELSHQTLDGLDLQSSPLEDSSLMLAFSDDKNAILDSQRGDSRDAKLILQEVKQFSETATFEGRLAQMMLTPADLKEKQPIDSSRTNILKNKLDVSPMNDPEPYAGFGEDTDEQEQKNDISCESLSIPN